MKDVIIALNVDISTINVDPKKVRKQLKNNKWGINQVPTLLLIHQNEDFKVLVGEELDQWFSELIDNIKDLEPKPKSEITPLTDFEEQEQEEEDINSGTTSIGTNPSYISSAIIQKNPKEETTMLNDEDSPKVTSSIKKEGDISPSEMAKRMAQQREKFDESVDSQRPFN